MPTPSGNSASREMSSPAPREHRRACEAEVGSRKLDRSVGVLHSCNRQDMFEVAPVMTVTVAGGHSVHPAVTDASLQVDSGQATQSSTELELATTEKRPAPQSEHEDAPSLEL